MADRDSSPTVSVVVPVYNGGSQVRDLVTCLLGQTLSAYEIIMVDDGSIDNTVEVLSEFADKIVVLTKPNGGPASARNFGLRVAHGEFIAFTDSDCLPQETWLSNLVSGFNTAMVGGVGGTIKRADSDMMSEYADFFSLLGPGIGSDGTFNYFPTANVCFRRSVLMEAGLFDERFPKPGFEDVELCYRIVDLRYELKIAEDALVLHHHRRTLSAFLRTNANYGEGRHILDTKWPEKRRLFNPRKECLKSGVAVRSMIKRCLAYRATYGLKRAALFSFLDHYGHVAYAWGYLRGERKTHHSLVQASRAYSQSTAETV